MCTCSGFFCKFILLAYWLREEEGGGTYVMTEWSKPWTENMPSIWGKQLNVIVGAD